MPWTASDHLFPSGSQFSGAPNSAFRHRGGLRRWHQRRTPAGCGEGGECARRWKEAAMESRDGLGCPGLLGIWENPWKTSREPAKIMGVGWFLNLMTILYGNILGYSRRYIAHGTCVGETLPMAIFLSKGARGTTFQTHRKWGNMGRTPSTHRYHWETWEVPSRWQTKLFISSLFLPYNHTYNFHL